MKAQVTMLLVRRWRSVNVLKYLLIRGTLIVINVSYLTANRYCPVSVAVNTFSFAVFSSVKLYHDQVLCCNAAECFDYVLYLMSEETHHSIVVWETFSQKSINPAGKGAPPCLRS